MFCDEHSRHPVQLFLSVPFVIASTAYTEWYFKQCIPHLLGLLNKSECISYLTEIFQAFFTLFCNVTCQYKVYSFMSYFLRFSSCGRLTQLSERHATGKGNTEWPHWRHGQKTNQDWFSEYARNHRPLSTTWPWSIRPSLAVIWGVCWMFYGNEDGNANRIPQNMLGENTLYDIDEMIEWPYSGGNTGEFSSCSLSALCFIIYFETLSTAYKLWATFVIACAGTWWSWYCMKYSSYVHRMGFEKSFNYSFEKARLLTLYLQLTSSKARTLSLYLVFNYCLW